MFNGGLFYSFQDFVYQFRLRAIYSDFMQEYLTRAISEIFWHRHHLLNVEMIETSSALHRNYCICNINLASLFLINIMPGCEGRSWILWRIIALQCCVGFCHTIVWVSQKYTRVASHHHPSRSLVTIYTRTDHQIRPFGIFWYEVHFGVLLLLTWTWVSSRQCAVEPVCIDTSLWWQKIRHFIAEYQARRPGNQYLKDRLPRWCYW